MSDELWNFFPDHSTPVTPLDVVWCHFPLFEQADVPALKARPALVRQVFYLDGDTYVEVAYGTSNLNRYSERDIFIANNQAMLAGGLPQATVFLLDRTERLPWAEEWFTTREDGTGPVIGHFSEQSIAHLRSVINHGRRE